MKNQPTEISKEIRTNPYNANWSEIYTMVYCGITYTKTYRHRFDDFGRYITEVYAVTTHDGLHVVDTEAAVKRLIVRHHKEMAIIEAMWTAARRDDIVAVDEAFGQTKKPSKSLRGIYNSIVSQIIHDCTMH